MNFQLGQRLSGYTYEGKAIREEGIFISQISYSEIDKHFVVIKTDDHRLVWIDKEDIVKTF